MAYNVSLILHHSSSKRPAYSTKSNPTRISKAGQYKRYVKGIPASQKADFQKFERSLKEYVKLAKQADQQMVRLEKLSASGKTHFKGVLNYAYARAQRDIRTNTGASGDNLRFNRQLPTNMKDLQRRMADVKQFINSSTNTVTKIKDLYQRRADITNLKYGTNFSWSELANYYDSEQASKLDAQYGSKTLIRALGAIKRLDSDQDRIREVIESNQKITKDAVVNEIAIQMLKEGYTADNLFNG